MSKVKCGSPCCDPNYVLSKPPTWKCSDFDSVWGVLNCLDSLTLEQSAAAKVIFHPDEQSLCPYTVFYPGA